MAGSRTPSVSREMPAFPHCAAVLQPGSNSSCFVPGLNTSSQSALGVCHRCVFRYGVSSGIPVCVCCSCTGARMAFVCFLHQPGALRCCPHPQLSSQALILLRQSLQPVQQSSARSRGSPCCREQPQPHPRPYVSRDTSCQRQDATVCCSAASWKGEQGALCHPMAASLVSRSPAWPRVQAGTQGSVKFSCWPSLVAAPAP